MIYCWAFSSKFSFSKHLTYIEIKIFPYLHLGQCCFSLGLNFLCFIFLFVALLQANGIQDRTSAFSRVLRRNWWSPTATVGQWRMLLILLFKLFERRIRFFVFRGLKSVLSGFRRCLLESSIIKHQNATFLHRLLFFYIDRCKIVAFWCLGLFAGLPVSRTSEIDLL